MLADKNHWKRNPYFQFHPMHNLYSLVMGLILFGALVLLMALPAR